MTTCLTTAVSNKESSNEKILKTRLMRYDKLHSPFF